jgi:hypothetical protein
MTDFEGFNPNVVALVEICHANAHTAEHDLEDAVLMSLTRREIWLMALALLILSQTAECLADDCATITERLVELMDVQKPHWQSGPELF